MKTKILKLLILIVVLLNISFLFSQEAVTVNNKWDAKLFFAGDDKGNQAGTINYSIRSEWQGKQIEGHFWFINTSGFMFIAPEFEYADLEGGIYRRYSANAGYTFNEWIEKFNFTTSIGYGVIQYNGGYRGFGANFQVSYEITKGVEVYLDAEFVDRKDQQIYGEKYNNNVIFEKDRVRFSGKFGVKVKVLNTKKKDGSDAASR